MARLSKYAWDKMRREANTFEPSERSQVLNIYLHMWAKKAKTTYKNAARQALKLGGSVKVPRMTVRDYTAISRRRLTLKQWADDKRMGLKHAENEFKRLKSRRSR